jgi:hypothetical protein
MTATTSTALSIVRTIFTPRHARMRRCSRKQKKLSWYDHLLTNTRQRRELLTPVELIDAYVSVYGCFKFKSHRHTSILYESTKTEKSSAYI